MSYTRGNPALQIAFLQQCFSGDKKPIGLFLGAGCPMAVPVENQGPLIPDIAGITKLVGKQLKDCSKHREVFDLVENHLKKDGICNPTVEDLLTHIRALGAVAGRDKARGLSAGQLDSLDRQICDLIYETVNKTLPCQDTPYHSVASWAKAIRRDSPVQIFTTNYDLLLEQALEETRVPYYDGFSGVQRPFFDSSEIEEDLLPPHWARLWKLHGSINWYQDNNRAVFRGTTNEKELRRVIHPSHLKYQESRRMPYLALVDKMRAFLRNPTAVFILCGYSFRDDHINETIRQGLRYTQTAVAFALLFDNIETYEKATALAAVRPNLNVLARDGGIIGGQPFDWLERDLVAVWTKESNPVFWTPTQSSDDQNRPKAKCHLGNFAVFGHFLQQLVGRRQQPWMDRANAS